MTEELKDDGNGKLEPKEEPKVHICNTCGSKIEYPPKDINDKEIIKTEEQSKAEQAKRFADNPETFIEISELICAVIRNPKSQLGVSVMIGNAKRSEIDISQSELNYRIDLIRRQMDVGQQSKIVPARHGILDFGRRRK